MAFDTTAQLALFSLIMMRMSGFILFNPIFGRRNIPMTVKAGVIMALTLAIYFASVESAFEVTSMFEFGFLLMKEFAVGYIIGYAMELFFFAITFGGYIIDFQLGLTMATVYDPQSNSQIAVVFCNGRTSRTNENTAYIGRDCSLWRDCNYSDSCREDDGIIPAMRRAGDKAFASDIGGGIFGTGGHWNHE